jgi:hypothetical protein
VEGAAASQQVHRHSNNLIGRFVNAACHVFCWNADHGYSTRVQPRVASQIALGTITHVMAGAVKLDREPSLRAIEIQNVGTDRMLASKNRLSRLSCAQTTPQARFRR